MRDRFGGDGIEHLGLPVVSTMDLEAKPKLPYTEVQRRFILAARGQTPPNLKRAMVSAFVMALINWTKPLKAPPHARAAKHCMRAVDINKTQSICAYRWGTHNNHVELNIAGMIRLAKVAKNRHFLLRGS